MEETKIVIQHDKEGIEIGLDNPGISTMDLLAIYGCFTNMVIKMMARRGMTIQNTIEALSSACAAAVSMHKQDMKKNNFQSYFNKI